MNLSGGTAVFPEALCALPRRTFGRKWSISIGEGFLQHSANQALLKALEEGLLTKDAYFQQILRQIYRLIFVFTVEERGVLHPRDDSPESQAARRAYTEGCALARLRDLCMMRRARTRHGDR